MMLGSTLVAISCGNFCIKIYQIFTHFKGLIFIVYIFMRLFVWIDIYIHHILCIVITIFILDFSSVFEICSNKTINLRNLLTIVLVT